MLSIIVKVNSYIRNRSYQETNSHTVMQNRLPGVNCRNTNRNWVKQRGKIFSAKNRGEGTEKVRRYDAKQIMGRLKFMTCKRNSNERIMKKQRPNILQNVIHDCKITYQQGRVA